jgi:glucose/mannose transport system substrate-binding protein
MPSTATRDAGARRGGVELAHFWGAGDGERMLAAVLEEFRSRHPEVGVTETAYDNHGLEIKSRILKQDPPSVFVEWPDRNLEPYHRAGAIRNITDVWEDNGWADAFIEGARERSRMGGEYVAVPVDIHRMNNVFYNVELAEEMGVDPARVDDPREFLEVLEACDAGGLVGMEQPKKNPSTLVQLFTNIFIGQFGASAFAELTREDPAGLESELREALELVDAYSELASEDAAFLDMVDASDRFVARESVFFHQGDWMAGEYADVADYDYGCDWGRVNFPGTDGVYVMGVDSVVAAENAGFGPDTRTFLEFVGSPEALEILNRIKGSIPPRRDISLDSYPQFLQEQFADFERADHFPAGHALQITPGAFVEVKTAFSDFLADRDPAATAAKLVDAYQVGLDG